MVSEMPACWASVRLVVFVSAEFLEFAYDMVCSEDTTDTRFNVYHVSFHYLIASRMNDISLRFTPSRRLNAPLHCTSRCVGML